MSLRLHRTLLITFTLIAVMVLGVFWLEFSFSFWWVFLGLPAVAITCELIFQYLIPARCPDCKARVQCHVLSREVDDPTGHGTRTTKIIKYYCPQCNEWLMGGQGLNTIGAMVGFFLGGLSGMGVMITLHEELPGGIVMGLFFLCPILGFAIGSLIGHSQRAQQRRKTMTEMMVELGPQRCAAYAFFAFAVLWWVLAIAELIPRIRLAIVGERVEGVVVEIREREYDDEYPRVRVIRFQTGQKSVELKRSCDFSVGDKVQVVYLPSDSDVAEIDTFYWLHSDWTVCAAFGCLPGFVSLIFYLLSRRPSWARKDR